MIRVMLDTDKLHALTGHVPLLATYSDLVPDPQALRAQFPHSQVLLIDRGLGDPSGAASIADVERGALRPADVPGWIDRKEAQHQHDITVYVNRDNIAAVDAAAAGRRFARWVATLDGTVHIDGYAPLAAPAAVQVLGAQALGYDADLSLVLEDGWNATPRPGWHTEALGLAEGLRSHLGPMVADSAHLVSLLEANG